MAVPAEATHTLFQPTRPVRGATQVAARDIIDNQFQPTRPVRRDLEDIISRVLAAQSIQPTRPVRGATTG